LKAGKVGGRKIPCAMKSAVREMRRVRVKD